MVVKKEIHPTPLDGERQDATTTTTKRIGGKLFHRTTSLAIDSGNRQREAGWSDLKAKKKNATCPSLSAVKVSM